MIDLPTYVAPAELIHLVMERQGKKLLPDVALTSTPIMTISLGHRLQLGGTQRKPIAIGYTCGNRIGLGLQKELRRTPKSLRIG